MVVGVEREALISVPELAKRTGFSARSVWRLIAERKTPEPIRFGRTIRFREADITEWIRRGCPDRDTFHRERECSTV